jgi:hypothetical protein
LRRRAHGVGLTLSGVGGMKVTQSASGPEAIEAIAGIEADCFCST